MNKRRRAILSQLRIDTAVRAILLFSLEGYLIDSSGDTSSLDIEALGALVAGEFAAAESLAKLIGNQLAFTANYHKGEEYSMYIHGIHGKGLLVVIFHTNNNFGIIRYYTNRAVASLENLITTGILPPLDKFNDLVYFEQEVDQNIDQLFSNEQVGENHD